jgi:hypothetical protein
MTTTNDYHARHEGLLDPTVLKKKRVLLFGAGSVGSTIAMLLGRAGLDELLVNDNDRVSLTNLCRTAYVAADVGDWKVEALARHLRAVRDETRIAIERRSMLAIEDEELVGWIGSADLVVAATDHPGVQARLSALTYGRVPAVFAGVYARGTGGEVIWTAPNETPCYACVVGSVRGVGAPDRGKTDYGIVTGQLAAEPALGIDIQHVAVCAAKVALALLLRGTTAPAASILDPSRSVLFVGNTVDWIWREPFEAVWARAPRRDRCLCRIPVGGSTAGLVDLGEAP